MQEILEDIQSGKFAREWMLENMVNRPVFNALTKKDEEHLIEDVGREVRAMMPQFKRDAGTQSAATAVRKPAKKAAKGPARKR
jgi:ketol-acid reductoisomerase